MYGREAYANARADEFEAQVQALLDGVDEETRAVLDARKPRAVIDLPFEAARRLQRNPGENAFMRQQRQSEVYLEAEGG